jgi:hypothetical protein
VGAGGERTYKKKGQYVERPKEEWVAVPVPDFGIPRERVDTARETLRGNSVPPSAGRRVWQISGGIAKCKECGRNMMIHSVLAPAPRAAASTTAVAHALGPVPGAASTASATGRTRWSRGCGISSPLCSETQDGSRLGSKR